MGSDEKISLLIVEDNDFERELIKSIVRKVNNIHVSCVSNGVQCLEYIKNSVPDIFLLDRVLPDTTGIKLCKHILSDNKFEHARIIFITGKDKKDNILEGFAAGAHEYIPKPFDAEILIARILCQKRIVELEKENRAVINDLKKALDEVNTLSGLLPICTYCKKIRDDDGYWERLEEYFFTHSDIVFSHGICEECAEKHFPEIVKKSKKSDNNE